ncbi:hypothetical protein WEI85_00300 [Actinomycetes bacterium KLBMP 9797]
MRDLVLRKHSFEDLVEDAFGERTVGMAPHLVYQFTVTQPPVLEDGEYERIPPVAEQLSGFSQSVVVHPAGAPVSASLFGRATESIFTSVSEI